MSQYIAGVVDVTNGSATVVGVGTLWNSEVSQGDWFVGGMLAIDGGALVYEVLSVTNNVELVLSVPWQGSTGSGDPYAIHRDFSPSGFAFIDRQNAALDAILNRNILQLENQPFLAGLHTRQLPRANLTGLAAGEFVIPPLATRITVVANLMSHGGGTADIRLFVGGASGYDVTNYATELEGSGGTGEAGFRVAEGIAAADVRHATLLLDRRQNSNRWNMGGWVLETTGTVTGFRAVGTVAMVEEMDKLKMEVSTGTFDGGTVSVLVE
jgi:hypothetical protein